MEVTITGIADDACSDCNETYNGTFTLPQTVASGCNYYYLIGDPGACDENEDYILVQNLNNHVSVTLWIGSDVVRFRRAGLGASYDCWYENWDVPYLGPPQSTWGHCQPDTPTCKLTALNCDAAIPGATPAQVQIDIAGMSDNACDECTDFNNASPYVLNWQEESGDPPTCYWLYESETDICSEAYTVRFSVSDVYDRIACTLRFPATGNYVTWSKDLGIPTDCNWNNVSLSYLIATAGFLADCGTGTCAVTSL
jgi:hypothetical protein